MIKCIIVDDEPLAIKLLTAYASQHDDLLLLESYSNPIDALHQLETLSPDLIFLDVQMPQLSGIQFLKILNNKVPVVLTTAYDQYALESYDYQVVDYLVKPISFDRFSKAIIKFQTYKNAHEITPRSPQKKSNESIETLFVKSGYKTVRITLANIQFMESKGDYLHITTTSETIKTLENLKDILPRLSPNFIRCHRSFVINMDKIDFIENNRINISGHFIPISRAYVREVQGYIKP